MNADGDSSGSSAAEKARDSKSSETGPQPGTSGNSECAAGVTIDIATPGVGFDDAAWIRDRLELVVSLVETEIDRRIIRCSVRIVGDPEMSDAHRRFSDVEGTTDVLTFATESEAGIEIDLLACVDEAARRCAEFDHDLRRELLLYGVHGLMHAIGHDDHEPEAHALMHAEEDRLLTKIGVGPIFRSHSNEGESR
ncbi:MAG: rRNA maturation RNase YbeY [Planctomycetota bacterium]|jgi:probable rRNA maturation factor|nr:rRNA maturation RNase YbeY [Planctomycetota bacterium]MDA1027067.1 rRNA maturation RNase YbeY [Planctomycetota bacterium]